MALPEPHDLADMLERRVRPYDLERHADIEVTLNAFVRCLREATVLRGGTYYHGAREDEYGPPRLVMPLAQWDNPNEPAPGGTNGA